MFLFDCDFCIFRISWFVRKTKKELERRKGAKSVEALNQR